MLKYLKNKIQKKIRRNFYTEIWHVGISKATIEDVANHNCQITWLPKLEPYQYIADPFITIHNDAIYIFVEEFDYRTKNGNIAYIKLDANLKQVEKKTILKNPYHNSYPFVFKHESKHYMIAESNQANAIILHRAEQFPDQWVEEKILIPDIQAVDTTLVKYENCFWLFFTVKSLDDTDCSELHIAYSDDLFGEWIMHDDNPVKIDKSSSRSAGKFFEKDGTLLRPAQDCSETYGGRIIINEIIDLADFTFIERAKTFINPFKEYPYGIHTINHAEGYTVIDGKQILFTPFKFLISWQRRFNRLFSK
jgi:hypothetical protein